MSRIDSAFRIDECAWSLTATRVRSPRPSPRFLRPVSRATVRADRLPAEPPETNTPPVLVGMPARSAMSRSTWFSPRSPPAASSAEIPWMLAPETSMSNSRAALVAAGMNARSFYGIRADHMRGQDVGPHLHHAMRVSALGGDESVELGGERRNVAGPVEGDGIHGEAVVHGGEDHAGQSLVVGVHVSGHGCPP